MSISFDGHIPRLNISTLHHVLLYIKCLGKAQKLTGQFPWTMSTESMEIVHCTVEIVLCQSPWTMSTVRVHGQYQLSPWTFSMDSVDNFHGLSGH